jgi:hypothetical protein
MGHPDEGLIRALLDGQLDERQTDAARRHLADCSECEAELRFQEEALARVSDALLLLDQKQVLAEARERIRRRMRARASRPRFSGSLLKAASIALLFTAVGASALPGSPVRHWVAQVWAALAGSFGEEIGPADLGAPGAESLAGQPGTESPETGTRIAPGTDGVELGLFDLSDGAEIRVSWIDGDQVGIFAGEGTRFRTEAGRLEAYGPPGAVRIEIPSALSRVLLTVDGRILLRKRGADVEILGSVRRQTPREVVFGPGTAPNEG